MASRIDIKSINDMLLKGFKLCGPKDGEVVSIGEQYGEVKYMTDSNFATHANWHTYDLQTLGRIVLGMEITIPSYRKL